jgi:hypothetical protein
MVTGWLLRPPRGNRFARQFSDEPGITLPRTELACGASVLHEPDSHFGANMIIAIPDKQNPTPIQSEG